MVEDFGLMNISVPWWSKINRVRILITWHSWIITVLYVIQHNRYMMWWKIINILIIKHNDRCEDFDKFLSDKLVIHNAKTQYTLINDLMQLFFIRVLQYFPSEFIPSLNYYSYNANRTTEQNVNGRPSGYLPTKRLLNLPLHE